MSEVLPIVLLILLPLGILALIFWPRKEKYVRDITSTRNGQGYWIDQEKY